MLYTIYKDYGDELHKCVYYRENVQEGRHPLESWKDLYELVVDGWEIYLNGEELPMFLVEENYKHNVRRTKKFCKDTYRLYGGLSNDGT